MLIHGLNFRINWRNFVPGASFFIPCLDTEQALAQIERPIKRFNYKIKSQIVVEKGIRGLRIWRIK